MTAKRRVSPERLAEIKAYCEKATPGSWRILNAMGREFVAAVPTPDHPYYQHTRFMDVAGDEDYPKKHDDHVFISSARTDLPAVVSDLEDAGRELETLKAGISELAEDLDMMTDLYESIAGTDDSCNPVCTEGITEVRALLSRIREQTEGSGE